MKLSTKQRTTLLTMAVSTAQEMDMVPTTLRHGKATVEEGFYEFSEGIAKYAFELVKNINDKRRDCREVVIATTEKAYNELLGVIPIVLVEG